MNRRLRILHVVGAMTGGGIQSYVRDLVNHFPTEECELDLCEMSAESGPLVGEIRPRLGRSFCCPITPSPMSYLRRFGGELKGRSYDVVHVHRSSSMMALPLIAARRAGVPVRIGHYHNVARRGATPLVRHLAAPLLRRIVLRTATDVVFVSRDVRASHFPNVPAHPRFHLLPNTVDVARMRSGVRARAREEFGFREDEVVIGHVARFAPAKNQRFLLRVAKRVLDECQNARFLLVGDGPLRADCERLAAELRIGNRVTFAGWRDDAPDMLAAMDVFFLPSLWEGLPIAVVEAQAAGLPCVASSLGCFQDVLHPEFLRRSCDVDDLEASAGVLRDYVESAELRSHAREWALTRGAECDISRAVEVLCGLYRGGGVEGS